MKHTRWLAALGAFAVIAPAVAGNDFGPYGGFSAGNVRLDNDLDELDLGFDAEDAGFSAYIGYQLTPGLAIEASYNDFGEFSELLEIVPVTTRFDAEVQGIDLFAVLKLPLGPIDLYGKAGLVFWDAETEAFANNSPVSPTLLGRFDDSGTNLALGGGAEVSLSDNLSLRGEIEWFDLEDAGTVSALSLGLSFHF